MPETKLDPRKLAEETAVAAVWLPRGELTRWDKNPRRHTQRSLAATRKSIERFGFVAPVIVWLKGDRMVAGHGRLKCYDALVEEHGPEWAPKHAPGSGLVPVRFMEFDSEKDANDYAIVDNRTTELSEWNTEELVGVAREFDSVEDTLREMALWSDAELRRMFPDEPGGDGGKGDPSPTVDPDDDFDDDPEKRTSEGEVVVLGRHQLTCGDCLAYMRSLPDNSVDAIVTDPPYGIGFMGKGWDSAVPGDEFAAEALRVIKPGGHLIAFAATRTVHRLTVALEDAGWEIRDQLAWAQWQGFPKSVNLAKALDKHHGVEGIENYTGANYLNEVYGSGMGGGQTVDPYEPASEDGRKWNGWGTGVKPAYEPAVLARKPLEGTLVENLLAHGVAGLNIDGCRFATGDPAWPGPNDPWESGDPDAQASPDGATWGGSLNARVSQYHPLGRFPANLYACPKPARSEREEGCEDLPRVSREEVTGRKVGSKGQENPRSGKTATDLGNDHPTVKPIRLMRWLVRLVTPPGGTVLEPFCGSGTTLLAAEAEGVSCLAAELTPRYCDIIRARYEAHARKLQEARQGSEETSNDDEPAAEG